MGDKYVPTEGLEFDDVNFNQRWPVKVPRFLHNYHGWWDYWELERNLSLEQHLKPGMVLWDVGAFDGWLAAVYQRFVGGPQNIVLIEPNATQWSNTKATWDANGLRAPRASFVGFLGDRDTAKFGDKLFTAMWPMDIDYTQIVKGISFRLMHEPSHLAVTECVRIDSLADCIGAPDAITLDIEGAEAIVMNGAFRTLSQKRPLIWMAVHAEFTEWRYHVKPLKIHKQMYEFDYEVIPISTDHEEHWLYVPR